MSSCLFPGSFDPPTAGHADIITRAGQLFDHVYVAVMANSEKHGLFTPDERVSLLRRLTEDSGSVTVLRGSGLTVDLARELGVSALIRGIRGSADADQEAQLAAVNRRIGGIETVALFSLPEHSCVSSTVVRDMLKYSVPLKGFVPESIEEAMLEMYRGKAQTSHPAAAAAAFPKGAG